MRWLDTVLVESPRDGVSVASTIESQCEGEGRRDASFTCNMRISTDRVEGYEHRTSPQLKDKVCKHNWQADKSADKS